MKGTNIIKQQRRQNNEHFGENARRMYKMQHGPRWSKMVKNGYSKDGKVLVASNKLENRRVRVSRPLLAHVQPPSNTSQYTALCHASFCCAVVQPNVLHMFIDFHPSSCVTKCTSHVH